MKTILKLIPFAAVIFLNIVAQASKFYIPAITPFLYGVIGILVLNLIIGFALKKTDYFTVGISSVAILGSIFVFLLPEVGQLYIENIIVGLYLGLFIVAFFPPLFKLDPFTFAHSKKDYPVVVTKGDQFLKINLILNYFWALIFAIAIFLTVFQYSDDPVLNSILATLVPIALQLGIGLPTTIVLPSYLIQKVSAKQLHFETAKDLFEAMPFGLNKKNAKDFDIIVQFNLTGEEPTTGYLTIKDQKCLYDDGVHANPTTTINCDSNLWVKISNDEVSGDKALINGEYTVSGDASILLSFASFFAPPSKEKNQKQKI